ncbi:MAG: hypothetical protein G01um10148_273 [Parcubacteria group bacterium Gr01-1014_8]|nr:MAG: hypothetical protein G01um10148_273 [Parcubacteria group bacterium Gr01-1014_8]
MGKLSIVATSIGNLEDITLRALRILKECNVIYCEDTRVTSKLLARYEIQKPLFRLDVVTEREKTPEVINRLERGEKVVYVSDAGTPGGLSDPGSYLVAHVRKELPEVKIEAIPGASPLTAAISIGGVLMNEFLFRGFLPHKKGRQTALKEIASSERPVVLFESPHRILKLLAELEKLIPEAHVVIARELTKIHEEIVTGTAREVAASLQERDAVRGEFVVLVEPTRE